MPQSMPQMSPEGAWMLGQVALRSAAKLGRKGDDTIGHLSTNDVVIPMERIKGQFKKELHALMKKHGIDVGEFTVGKDNKRNPETDLPEFMDGGEGGGGGDAAGGGTGGGDIGGREGEAGVGAHAGEAAGATGGVGGTTGATDGGGGGGISGFFDSMIHDITTDPIGTIASAGLNLGFGLLGPIGLAGQLVSRGFTGQSLGGNIVGAVEGRSPTLGGPIGGAIAAGDVGPPTTGTADNTDGGTFIDSNYLDKLVNQASKLPQVA